ncbi:unnamed protein product [Didymodactylos carnosus]|uniref:RFX-type winged-helix domain-containing protein n=1 Tax=Didymodactylos carnosus TaxID=1234261 RepID=A0A8S2DTI5_9BILA|nr:unnamed protein product [Didymodactylos carnosus]CAF3814310.1 unnamed protein product [Didymodactylos carnosus]
MTSDQVIERWCRDHATPATVQWLVDNFEPGSSIRRSILYNFYLEHCLGLKVEPLNPASFGKLIHSVFLGLRTRRLGTRGNSKYHYYGIRVKNVSPLSEQMPFDGGSNSYGTNDNENTPIVGHNMSEWIATNGNECSDSQLQQQQQHQQHNNYSYSNSNINNNPIIISNSNLIDYQSDLCSSQLYSLNCDNYGQRQQQTCYTQLSSDLNDIQSSTLLLPSDVIADDLTINDLKLFQKSHDEYCAKLYQAFTKFQFSYIETLIIEFWSLTNVNFIISSKLPITTLTTTNMDNLLLLSSETKLNHETYIKTDNTPMMYSPTGLLINTEQIKFEDHQYRLLQWKFYRICTLPFVIDQLRIFYIKFYQAIIDIYFPDILTNMSHSMTTAIRTMAHNSSYWIIYAIQHLCEPLKTIMINLVQAFSSILLRYTSLNHLCIAVHTMLIQPSRLLSMSNDIGNVDFHDLHDQAHWLLECDMDLCIKIEQCIKSILQCRTITTIKTTENWTILLETLLYDILKPYEDTKEYIAASRKFLLKFSFYCSLIIRDLTLHYGDSLGSFHLLETFLEEYIRYRIEQKISQAMGQSVLMIVIENMNNEKNKLAATMASMNEYEKQLKLQQQSNDDEIVDEDVGDDEDLYDDVEENFSSISEIQQNNHYYIKPLSPVDDLLLNNENRDLHCSTNKQQCIFEDLQPITSAVF